MRMAVKSYGNLQKAEELNYDKRTNNRSRKGNRMLSASEKAFG